MSGWTVAWLLWFAMMLAVEVPAVLNKTPGDTLSEHIWKWFSIKGKSKGWRWRRVTLLAFLAWLCAHMLSGGFF